MRGGLENPDGTTVSAGQEFSPETVKTAKRKLHGVVSSNMKSAPKNVKTRMNTGFHAGWAMAEAVGFEPTRAFTLPDFESGPL